MTSTISAPSQANVVVAEFEKVSSMKITGEFKGEIYHGNWNKCPVFPANDVTFKTACLKFFLNTVLGRIYAVHLKTFGRNKNCS